MSLHRCLFDTTTGTGPDVPSQPCRASLARLSHTRSGGHPRLRLLGIEDTSVRSCKSNRSGESVVIIVTDSTSSFWSRWRGSHSPAAHKVRLSRPWMSIGNHAGTRGRTAARTNRLEPGGRLSPATEP